MVHMLLLPTTASNAFVEQPISSKQYTSTLSITLDLFDLIWFYNVYHFHVRMLHTANSHLFSYSYSSACNVFHLASLSHSHALIYSAKDLIFLLAIWMWSKQQLVAMLARACTVAIVAAKFSEGKATLSIYLCDTHVIQCTQKHVWENMKKLITRIN